MESPPPTLDAGEGPKQHSERLERVERGATVGRYVVLDVLGKGGMGVVYAAFDPELDRKVALKVLRPDARQGPKAQARLLREAKAIAQVSHPNVVAVHDVGDFGDRVFVAMEFIAGQTLAEWMEPGHSFAEVLEVFVPAARGLRAAHDVGLVHRDFKPDNVMLGLDGRVRVMDFGLARTSDDGSKSQRLRAVDEELISASVSGSGSPTTPSAVFENSLGRLTQTGSVMGTPAYMAPEQYLRGSIDARTDQFAFCVALFEALYGHRPFEGKTVRELAIRVCAGKRVEPRDEGSVPPRIKRALVRGLSKKPDDRWASMGELLEALEHDPGVRRRRIALGVLGATGVVGMVVGAYAMQPTARDPCVGGDAMAQTQWGLERRQALEAAFEGTGVRFAKPAWEAFARGVDDHVRQWTHEWRDACEDTHVRSVQSGQRLDLRMACLDRRHAELEALLTLQSDATADSVIGAVSSVRGLVPPEVCADVELLSAAVPLPDDPAVRVAVDRLRAQLDPARALLIAGAPKKAKHALEVALPPEAALAWAPARAEYQLLRAAVFSRNDDIEEAEEWFNAALDSAALGRRDDLIARGWIDLLGLVGTRKRERERVADLERMAQAALVRAGSPVWLESRLFDMMGRVARLGGRLDEAKTAHARALALNRARNDPMGQATSMLQLGSVLVDMGQLDEGREQIELGLALKRKLLGESHPNLATELNLLGKAFERAGKPTEAESYFRHSLELRRAAFGDRSTRVAEGLSNLGIVVSRSESRLEESEALLREAVAIYTEVLGAEHPDLAMALDNLGTIVSRREPAEGIELNERALEIRRKNLGPKHPETANSMNNLAAAYLRGGADPARAEALWDEAIAVWTETLGPDHVNIAIARLGLSEFYLRTGKKQKARETATQALAVLSTALGDQHPATESARQSLTEAGGARAASGQR